MSGLRAWGRANPIPVATWSQDTVWGEGEAPHLPPPPTTAPEPPAAPVRPPTPPAPAAPVSVAPRPLPSASGFAVVTERWPSLRSYWACTFCAALMGRRWETWKTSSMPPGTEAEVRALAAVSGDDDVTNGSVGSQMRAAVRNRYHRSWSNNPQTRDEFMRYMATAGTMAIVKVNAGRMPSSVRAHYGSFTGYHRTTAAAIGRSGKVTIYDPMMPQGHRGVEITLSSLWTAMIPDEVVIVHAPK